MAEVLVLAEQADPASHGGSGVPAVRHASLELLTLARGLGEPVAMWLGEVPDAVRAELGEYGVATVLSLLPDADVTQFLATPLAEALMAGLRAAPGGSPAALLVTSSFENKEVAARVAVATRSGVIVDVARIAPDAQGRLVAEQSVFTGSYHVRSVVTQGTPILAVKANAVQASPAESPRDAAAVVDVPVTLSEQARATRVVSRTPRASSGRPELVDAPIVVAAGRGMGPDLTPLEELADALGAALGATRVVVDEGWIDHSAQIGQTGVTIQPSLYIGAGVSGAIHHRSGMQGAQTIVAINTDPDAPIFEMADYGIVGDATTIVPQLTARVRERRS